MEKVPPPIGSDRTGAAKGEPGPPPYHPPLLRSHGALHDLTAQSKSGDKAPSDARLKENFVPVVWA